MNPDAPPKVVSLIPNNALALDQEQLAARIRTFADRIEAKEFGDVERVVILFEDAYNVRYRAYGRPTTNMELVGLMSYAKNSVMNGDIED